ncbi:hypothetical protein FDZ84_13775 [Saccharopolyspora sp. ASAGF58]|nr:hypothetical protein FDZ84_13775 [Saccharopolyspora sp. ASAGF58]
MDGAVGDVVRPGRAGPGDLQAPAPAAGGGAGAGRAGLVLPTAIAARAVRAEREARLDDPGRRAAPVRRHCLGDAQIVGCASALTWPKAPETKLPRICPQVIVVPPTS